MNTCDPIQVLIAGLVQLPPGALAIGYSGGLDSSVLLHALMQIPQARNRGLRALHIDHGLHPESARWAAHCRDIAARAGIELHLHRISVAQTTGTGLEDAARRARYAAFAQALRSGEVLVLAHHRDDQAETILLKLLRGAGPEGLGGMRTLREFSQGYLWRPMLDMPRASLLAYARQHALTWVEDPSNHDLKLRRNYLREHVLPELEQHWPQARAAIAHSAAWSRAAAQFIDEQAAHALARIRAADPTTVSWRAWLELPDALRSPVLRRWLRDLRLPEPAHFHVAELERQLRGAGNDRLPCVNWAGAELRRYRDLLYALAPLAAIAATWEVAWNGAPLVLPDGAMLTLEFTTQPAATTHAGSSISTFSLSVRYRRGGERIRPAGDQHTRELRALLQQAGIAPWLRPRIPLIYHGSELLAIGDLWRSCAGQELCERLGARIVWTPKLRFADADNQSGGVLRASKEIPHPIDSEA